MASISTQSAPVPNTEETSLSPRSVPATTQSSTSFPLPELAENLPNLHGFTGRSPAIRQLISQMRRLAPHLVLAILEGEEGSGSSLAARALHAEGPAAHAHFVSTLATHFFTEPQRGSTHPWSVELLRRAKGGMLFLDRVHELSAVQQARLASFLHWFDYSRLPLLETASDTSPLLPSEDVPAQIVFSSRFPLRGAGSHTFREELASRLCAVRFSLPALSQRREDIPLLAHIFVQRFARAHGKTLRGLGPGSIAPLLRYAWPGNVRELEEVINAAAVVSPGPWIRPVDFPPLPPAGRDLLQQTSGPAAETHSSAHAGLGLDQAIFEHVTRVLDRTRGNKLRAARLLGISRSTLYRILAGKEALGDSIDIP